MRFRIGRKTLLSAVVVFCAFTPFAWDAALRLAIDSAMPAGAKHSNNAVPALPDGEHEVPSTNNFVSAAFMKYGYCYARSKLNDPDAIGGFGECGNAPIKVRIDADGRGLFILAQPGVVSRFTGSPGMRVVLVNQTKDLLAFAASDSRLSIVQEAQDTDGTWKPIDYLPASHCGNSFHRVFLPPNHFWAFSAPRYKGAIPTKLRFAMTLADGSQLCSNVFEGSINHDQFSAKH